MMELYFNRVALLSSVLIIDEPAFDFADDLAEDIGEDPDPNGWERTVHLLIDSVFDKLFLFLGFVLVGENEEEDAQGDHDSGDDQLSYFLLAESVPLQCLIPELTIKMKVPSSPMQKIAYTIKRATI